MNEETTVPVEESVPESIEPLATEVPETAPETTDGSVTEETTVPESIPQDTTPLVLPGSDPVETTEAIYEDFSGALYEETVPVTTEPVVTVDIVESVGSDIIHADLFGSFLVCGTLIGLALLRGIHGT